MRKRVTKHIKGNLWAWTGGFAAAGAAAAALHWGTIAAFILMITGILIIMADARVDPLAILTEDVLHPEGPEIDQPPGTGTGSPVT
jgi:hypothetical protein